MKTKEIKKNSTLIFKAIFDQSDNLFSFTNLNTVPQNLKLAQN